MGLKVLFVYPNYRGMNMLPPAIGLMSSVLKDAGFTVRLFDTTYYQSVDGKERTDSDASKADRLMARPYKHVKEITLKTTNVFTDFEKEVDSYSPDLIAMSVTEDMWHLGKRLLQQVGKFKILTIVGGVFPTFAPDLVLREPEVDIVCKGEGEVALRTLCERLEKKQPFDDISNLWIKTRNGGIKANPISMINMDDNPLIDMSIFEEARFYRPMGGKMWRMFPVETHRGCPYKCAFCNSPSQIEMYKKEANQGYLRRKSFENMRRELLFYKEEMKAEYLYFWADTFFVWKPNEFEQFCEIYEDIKLPFWCQTRIETVQPERLKRLKEIGGSRISLGIEHGNQDFRFKWIKRPVPNETMVKHFKILKDSGIPFSVNNIIGFPHETRDLAFDTIRLNRQIQADDRNAYPFTPFHGTPLRQECEKQNFLKHGDIVRSMVANGSLLNMPQFPQEQVNSICKTFNMYVKFEESRWPEIEKAEQNTPEGARIFEDLKNEFVERFWDGPDQSFEQAANEQ